MASVDANSNDPTVFVARTEKLIRILLRIRPRSGRAGDVPSGFDHAPDKLEACRQVPTRLARPQIARQAYGVPAFEAAANPRSRSAHKSPTSSIPTDSLTSPSPMPSLARVSAGM